MEYIMAKGCSCYLQENNVVKCECNEEVHSHEHGNRRNDYISLGISLILIIAMFFTENIILKYTMGISAALVSGSLLYLEGIKSIFRRNLNETTLMFIAVVAAFCIGEYFEAALVAFLFRLGELIEEIAVDKSQKSIEAVLDIRPDSTLIQRANGAVEKVKASQVRVGDIIHLKPGDRLALDAIVVEGSSQLDNSALTGESIPVVVSVGDTVLSGALNINGYLVCEVIRDFDHSTASQIIELVKESAAKKSRTERFIRKFAQVYTPLVFVGAILLTALPPLFGLGDFSTWLYRALVFLVAACPCALVISVPMCYFCAIGVCSKVGVLVKGGRFIEMLAGVDTIAFDKTGTITTGQLTIDRIDTIEGLSEAELLEIAICCESGSNHPIANAITQAGTCRISMEEYTELAGKGILGKIDGKDVLCGNKLLLQEQGVSYDLFPDAQVYVAVDGVAIGAITLKDTVKKEAPAAIRQLKRIGINDIAILSGDREEEVQRVAKICGIQKYHSGLLPQDKAKVFESIKNSEKTVAFVGDGINDAPVLALADIGIAVATGTDAAAQAADVVLMSDNLMSLSRSVTLSRNALLIAKQNIVFALGIKAIVLVLGALGIADMTAAVFADVGVTVLSVLNAMRILRKK